MKLFTIYSDYGATGEGRTMQALITYAEDEVDAIKKFAECFNPYFAVGAEAKEGIVKNELTQYLFTPQVFAAVENMEGRANLKVYSEMHFNFS